MAKQDRNVWFDSINHLPLKPISSTTEQSNKEKSVPNQTEQPTPNRATVQASDPKECQEGVPSTEPSNNKHLSENKSLSKETLENEEAPIPSTKVKKVVKKAATNSKPSAQHDTVSPNDPLINSGSANTDPLDIASIGKEEEEIFPPTEDVPIVDKQLDDQMDPLSKETLSEKNESPKPIQKTGSTRRKRAAKNSSGKKSTPIKRSKNQSSSDKEKKHITSRMLKDTYKEMIAEYPFMNRTELVDSIVKFFFEHPKRQRDQWLNEQCGGLDKY